LKEGSPYPLSGEKLQSPLAYLVLYPRLPHRREKLADMLFMDAPFDRVRRNFSDTLYRLQKVLGSDWFIVEGDTVMCSLLKLSSIAMWQADQPEFLLANRPPMFPAPVHLYTGGFKNL